MVRLAHHKLGEICEINPRNDKAQGPNLEVGFLTMADVSEDAKILIIQKRKLSEVKNGFSSFANGDVLIAKITPCFENGKGAFVDGLPNGIGFGSTEFHVLRTNKGILLNRYLYHIVSDKKFRKIYAKFMTGSAGQQRISTDFLKKVKIPLPPLATQKQIVERLDKIAEAQKLNDDLIQKSDELFQSLLHQELNPAGKNWEVKKLSEVLEINYGKGLDKSKRVDSGKFFAYGSNGPVYRANESLIDSEVIVIGRKGTAGALYFVSEPCWPIDTTFFARPKSDASLKFIYYLLQTKNLPRLAIVTGVPGINRTTLSNINIKLPPLRIQKQIVAKLLAVQEYKGRLFEQKAKLKELFDSVLDKSMKVELN